MELVQYYRPSKRIRRSYIQNKQTNLIKISDKILPSTTSISSYSFFLPPISPSLSTSNSSSFKCSSQIYILPVEILILIFNYLNEKDIFHLFQLNKWFYNFLTNEKLIWIHLYDTIIDRLNYEERKLIHLNEIPNFNQVFKMINDIRHSPNPQIRFQNDDQMVATLEEDQPSIPSEMDTLFDEENEYDRMVVDLNRDILLNDLENYDNSFISNIDQVRPHLVIYHLPKNHMDLYSYDISNFHKLSCHECRFVYTYYYYYRPNICGICKKAFSYNLTGIKVWTIRLCPYCAFKNIITRKILKEEYLLTSKDIKKLTPWFCSINYNLDNDQNYKNKYYGFRIKNDRMNDIKKHIIFEFYFRAQAQLLLKEKFEYNKNKETFDKNVLCYKNRILKIHKNINDINSQVRKNREIELQKLIQSNNQDFQQNLDFTNLPYRIYSCIQLYLNKGSTPITYGFHSHPLEFLSLAEENMVEYEIRNSYVNYYEDDQYLKLSDILKIIKLHFQNTKIWNDVFYRLKNLYHITLEECQTCLLFHLWILEYQNINYILPKDDIKKYVEESINKIIKIKEVEEKIHQSLSSVWDKNCSYLIEKKLYKRNNSTTFEKFCLDAKKKFLKDNKPRFNDILYLTIKARNIGEDYLNFLKNYILKKGKTPKLNSLIYQNYINERIQKFPIKIKNEIYNNIMNEHGDKELKEIYNDYIYDQKKNCNNHSNICLDAAVNDLKIRYIVMCEEKKLNQELKYWFGESFFGYESLHTNEGKKAYKDGILNTSATVEYDELDEVHFYILGYMIYKTELLNDILQRLLPDFSIENISDECLKVYNDYIGDYDNYMDEIDNEFLMDDNYDFRSIKEKYGMNDEYITLSNYMQYPYSTSSISSSSQPRHKCSYYTNFECFHEYIVLNEMEDDELNKTLDAILKLESIKKQRISYVLNIIKKEEKVFSGFCKRNFRSNSIKIVRPEKLEKYIDKPTDFHIKILKYIYSDKNSSKAELECTLKDIRIKEIKHQKSMKIKNMLRNNIMYQNLFIDAYQRYDFLHSFWMDILFSVCEEYQEYINNPLCNLDENYIIAVLLQMILQFFNGNALCGKILMIYKYFYYMEK